MSAEKKPPAASGKESRWLHRLRPRRRGSLEAARCVDRSDLLASTYTFADTQSLIDFIVQKQPREEYARYGNPNEKTVERKLAVLEGAEAAVLYASGMTAIAGLLLAKLRAGDEIVLFDECYHAHPRDFCLQELSRFGIATRLVPTGDYEPLGSGHLAGHAAAVQRIAHQSAPERDRPGAIRRHRPAARRRDGDRRHAGHALQRPAAGVRHRLRAALLHEVPRRAQRSAGRRRRRLGGETGAAAEVPRLWPA